jgi:hypothetical protein
MKYIQNKQNKIKNWEKFWSSLQLHFSNIPTSFTLLQGGLFLGRIAQKELK